MSFIERWVATNPPNAEEYTAGWEPKALSSERDADTYQRLGWQVVEVVPAEQLRGAVEALRELADAVRGDGSEQDRALAIMRALTKADAITGGSRPASDEEDAAQPRWVVGGCYEDNRLRLIEGRALGAREQLTLVEARE